MFYEIRPRRKMRHLRHVRHWGSPIVFLIKDLASDALRCVTANPARRRDV